MSELNREEIIKALECCYVTYNCNGCPLYNKNNFPNGCIEHVIPSALALIKELTEENERFHASYTELTQCCTKLKTLYKIECKRVDTVKADTVRKMQERLRERLNRNSIFKGITMSAGETVYDVIDQIAKEMLEG